MSGIRAIGIDEIHWQHGANFLTLVYQIDPTRKRLWIGQPGRAKTLLQFFRWFGKERTAVLVFICSDMLKPYLKVVAKKAGHALHILDRFHIAKHMSEAIDRVRRAEVRWLRQRGRQPLLTKARWVLLKRRENQTRDQRARLRELVQHNLRAVRAMLLREWFDDFWHYRSVDWAGAFLDEWCVQVMRSRLEPMKKVAPDAPPTSPAAAQLVSGAGGDLRGDRRGFNNKARLTTKSLWLSLISLLGNRLVPYVESATGAGNDPQILLKTPRMRASLPAFISVPPPMSVKYLEDRSPSTFWRPNFSRRNDPGAWILTESDAMRPRRSIGTRPSAAWSSR